MLSLPPWKRVVIKVGSALIAPQGKCVSTKHLLGISRLIAEFAATGKQVVLVSSGAVAAGISCVPNVGNQRYISEKQALAAIGQSLLMSTWGRFFDFPCAQVLLTHDDFRNRRRYVNAKNTLREILRLGCLPIVNENDTVSVDELKLGDNDNLAAHVAGLIDADLLVILSDVDGLHDANPRLVPQAKLIPEVLSITPKIYALAGDTHNARATGGMRTKIQAAEKAVSRGIHCVIAAGTKRTSLDALLEGHTTGTLFHSRANPISAKKHWLRHVVPVSGRIVVDHGAALALQKKGASLLPPGVLEVGGGFSRGEAVEIFCRKDQGNESRIAKGITQYKLEDCRKIMGHHSDNIQSLLGFVYSDVIIHRDDLVFFKPEEVLV